MGCFSASGDKKYVDKMLNVLESSIIKNKYNVSDILIISKKNASKENIKNILEKYNDDKKSFMSFMTASSLLWSLASNAKQHEIVWQTICDYMLKIDMHNINDMLLEMLEQKIGSLKDDNISVMITTTKTVPKKEELTDLRKLKIIKKFKQGEMVYIPILFFLTQNLNMKRKFVVLK